jgi:hypothetical protein
MLEVIDPAVPWPIDTIAITDPIPITIPKIVKPERALLAIKAKYVSCIKSVKSMRLLFMVADFGKYPDARIHYL